MYSLRGRLIRLVRLGVLIAIFGGLSACRAENLHALRRLERVPAPVSVATLDGEFCTLNLNTPPGLKFYFVIDVTGSNGWTDPGRVRRTAGMRAMLQKYPGAKFALQSFSSEASNSLFVPFQLAEDFEGTLLEFQSNANSADKGDTGGTPYAEPLKAANRNLAEYMGRQLSLPLGQRDAPGPIVVIFISDGVPTDGITTTIVDQLVKDILRLPIALNALDVTTEIIANSGVYGNDRSGGSPELRQIATSGYGVFLDFDTGAIDFSRFRIPTDRSPAGLSFGFFATNLNVAWDRNPDGTVSLEADSDGDGLSDRTERTFHSQGLAPASSLFSGDSDGNGVSDGVEAFYFKTPCANSDCTKPLAYEDVRKPVTCDFIPLEEGGGMGTYAGDILNNCEKLIAHANYKLFSTITDKIPDGVKVRNGISPKDATLTQPDPETDNLTPLQKLMVNLPWWFPGAKSAGLKATQYQLKFAGLRNERSCYSFSIRDLPYKELAVAPGADPSRSRTNKVRLWLTQSNRDLRDVLRVAEVQFIPGATARLTDADFK